MSYEEALTNLKMILLNHQKKHKDKLTFEEKQIIMKISKEYKDAQIKKYINYIKKLDNMRLKKEKAELKEIRQKYQSKKYEKVSDEEYERLEELFERRILREDIIKTWNVIINSY